MHSLMFSWTHVSPFIYHITSVINEIRGAIYN